MPKFSGVAEEDDGGRAVTFSQLLNALRVEHEREVGDLLTEVRRLRVSSDCHMQSFPAAKDAFDEQEKFPSNLTGSATCTSLFEQCPSRQHVTLQTSNECAAVVPRRDCYGECADAVPSQTGLGEIVRRGGGSKETLSSEKEQPGTDGAKSQSLLWPIWDNSPGSVWESEGGQSETWLQEALTARAACRSASSQNMDRILSQNLKAKSPLLPWMLSGWGSLPLMPASRVKMLWDLAASLALLYDVIMVPMHAFTFRVTLWQQGIEAAILTYWLLDIPVTFNSAYVNEYGELVADYRRIAGKYLRTWFTPDVLITGLDLVTTCYIWGTDEGSAASHNMEAARLGKFFRIVRIIRILRLGRVAKVRQLIYELQVYFDNEALSIVWGVCANLLLLLILNHINACLWFWVGSLDYKYTWLNSTRYQGDLTFADTDMWNQYFASLHWSLALFTPAGMSVQPKNLVERIYAVVSLLPGLVIFASFISHVTAGMTRLRQIQTENLEHSFTLRRFLKENDISSDLVARVTRYVSIAKTSHKKRIPKEAVARLKWLSGPLYMELLWELSAPTLKTHSFFEMYGGLSASAMRELCFSAIKVHSVSRRDTVFSSFEKASRVYFLRAGSLVYRRAHGLNFLRRVSLQRGDWFVEHVLWMQWVHRGTLKALTESDLMSVDAETFRQVSRGHPEVMVTCAEYAHVFVRGCQERPTCDVPQEIFRRAVVPKTEKSFWDVGREADFGHEADFDMTFSSDSDSGDKSENSLL